MSVKQMMAVLAACVAMSCAHAGVQCTSTEWHSENKIFYHGAAMAAGVFIVSGATDNSWIGAGTGAALALYREYWKRRHGYNCEWSSMAWDAAGIAIGSIGSSKWRMRLKEGGAEIHYETDF